MTRRIGLICLYGFILLCRATDSAGSPAKESPAPTCPTGTINYITHSLLSQCLESHRTPSSTHSSSLDESSTPKASPSITVTAQPVESTSLASSPPSSSDTGTSSSGAATATVVSIREVNTEASRPSDSKNLVAKEIELDDAELESPLDNAKFLSFEEWKKENLAQAGQSAETFEQEKGGVVQRQRPPIQNALDSLGDDAEIDIDLTAFGSAGRPSNGKTAADKDGVSSNSGNNDPNAKVRTSNHRLRNVDAGKTCKERSNYASFDNGATILKTNSKCKSASSILVEHKDSYMLNECGIENKFFIVELSDSIKVDTVVLANYEYFSSQFRTFRISVSDRYPVKLERWKELGVYEARNSRDIQAFLVEEPLIWARYLRIEFLAQYGNEFYCPVSLLRVHGTTMMEEFRYEQELAFEDEVEDEYEAPESLAPSTEAATNDAAVIQTPLSILSDNSSENVGTVAATAISQQGADIAPSPSTTIANETALSNGSPTANLDGEVHVAPQFFCRNLHVRESVNFNDSSRTCATSDSVASTTTGPTITEQASNTTTLTSNVSSIAATTATTTTPVILTSSNSLTANSTANTTTNEVKPIQTEPRISATSSESISGSINNNTISGNSSLPFPTNTSITVQNSTLHVSNAPASSSTSFSSLPSSSSIAPASQTPVTQESFFKSIHKRLQALEANATLSLQYIESQSQLLREAFGKVEKRQLSKTTSFLDTLNTTVLSELNRFKADYEQLWQSTVLELAGQRDERYREQEALNDRMKLLAEEIVSQKRLMAVQATLLLLCLGVVVFTKAAPSAGVDVSLLNSVQELVQRRKSRKGHDATSSSSARQGSKSRWQWDSGWLSPPRSAASTRPNTANQSPRRDVTVPTSPVHRRGMGSDTDGSRPGGYDSLGQASTDEDGNGQIRESIARHGTLVAQERPSQISFAAGTQDGGDNRRSDHDHIRERYQMTQSAPTTPQIELDREHLDADYMNAHDEEKTKSSGSEISFQSDFGDA